MKTTLSNAIMTDQKTALRERLAGKYHELWPGGEVHPMPLRVPFFAGAAKAAEALRRLPAYRHARTLAITAEPVLLQARINALMDNKVLLVATPGLKQGLVRITSQNVPINRRRMDLHGHAMFKAGKPLPLFQSHLGQADMLVSTAMAIDDNGVVLGDGRGLLDVLAALLGELKVLAAKAPVIILAHSEQRVADIPREAWDLRADTLITPDETINFAPAPRPFFMPERLAPAQARLPIIKAFMGAQKTGEPAVE